MGNKILILSHLQKNGTTILKLIPGQLSYRMKQESVTLEYHLKSYATTYIKTSSVFLLIVYLIT